MKKQSNNGPCSSALAAVAVLFLLIILVSSAQASFTIKVTGNDNTTNPPTASALNDFKWVIQEDDTTDSVANAGVYNNYNSQSVTIHKSNAKVLASGTGSNPVVNLPPGRYFVSVMSPNTYSVGGGPVRPEDDGKDIHIVVNKYPIPTTQVTVFVFHDNNPINGAPDLPSEGPLAGFRIYLFDQLGQQSQDAFGNPLGTIYNSDANGIAILDPVTGLPTIKTVGAGYVTTSATMDANFNYNALIPNLAPGKYGVWALPGDGRPWIQTATIEGTPGIDTWLLAGGPNYFTANGTFGTHADIGFVLPSDYDQDPLAPKFTVPDPSKLRKITGQVVQNRVERPPLQLGLNPGNPVTNAYIGLSDINNGNKAVFAMGCPGSVTHGTTVAGNGTGSSCDDFSRFTIQGVPPGTYTLTMWDLPLDQIIDFRTITVPAPTVADPATNPVTVENCAQTGPNYPFCPSPVFQWFGTLEGSVSVPTTSGGQLLPTLPGLSNEVVNIRFKDGTLFSSTVTDPDGSYSFKELFPFFHWLVIESDPADNKPMGATVSVDKGGAFSNPVWDYTGANNVVPLLEKRTDPPGTNSEAAILYMSETNKIDFFKRGYSSQETGYVFGFVSYAFTRTPVDPSLSVASIWEPGVPNVHVNLYKVDVTQGAHGYDPATGKPILVKDQNGSPKVVASVLSDSWDDSLPTGCLDSMKKAGIDINAGQIPLDKYIDCSETLPIWNQIKPGVFDGAYKIDKDSQGNPLAAGDYVVEVVPPTGYEIYKEEDENFTISGVNPPNILPSVPQPASLNSLLARTFHAVPPKVKPKLAVSPPACVGPDHTVPAFMSFDGATPSPLAGQVRPLCTMKLVHLQPAQNFGADFRIFTQVPIAARLIGLTTDDLALEFRPGNPRLGDKIGPSFMPVSVQDYKGNELTRGYTDEWGQYNMLVPSTYWTDTPNPTGISPHVVKIILNPPFLADPVTRRIDPRRPDPFWKPGYPANQPFPMDMWPGKITYADTPMVPIRPAIDTTNINYTFPDATPVISQLNGPAGGPWVETPSSTSTITITSAGQTTVANPDPASQQKTLVKNYGFGTSGSVFVTPVGDDFGGATTKKLQVLTWADGQVVTNAITLDSSGAPGPVLANGDYQLTIMRNDNFKTDIIGITIHVGTLASKVKMVSPDPSGLTNPIQDAIDAANNGDLIMVAPGVYPENVILWKPVKLQGAGAYSTTITAGDFTPVTQATWLAKLNAITGNQVDTSPFLIDAQRPDFFLEQGAAVMVLAPNAPAPNLVNGTPATINPFDNTANKAMIDGFTLTQANLGGGIFVNANANYMQISNNRLISNNGTFGGGIRVGNPGTVSNINANQYVSSLNGHMLITYNQIAFNGGTGFAVGSGGGIGLYKGSDNYVVSNNWITGNYALLAGAGIAHQGVSNNGLIKKNTIIFNESFDEGAGILLAGELPIANVAAPANILSEGVGNVVINDNLIQGNKGGNLGGGIALARYNGQEVSANPTNTAPVAPATTPVSWYKAEIYNNMIVNNLSGAFGGGIGITDALDVTIAGNTVANNDSTATGELAFGNSTITLSGADTAFTLPTTRQTTPLPAGIGVQPLSTTLLGSIGAGIRPNYQDTYAVNPVIVNDIIYGNLSYYWAGFNQAVNAGINILTPFAIWDLGVFTDPTGTPGRLNPQYSLITETSSTYPQVKHYPFTGAGIVKADQSHDPQLFSAYRNSISATQGGAALGNFVAFSFSPMTLTGNYHIKGNSSARNVGTAGGAGIFSWNHTFLDLDFDGDSRVTLIDIGADQYNAKGDLNGDNVVNALDALIALKMAVGTFPMVNVTPEMLTNVHVAPLSITGRPASGAATYNPPVANTVSVADALLILQRAIGLIFW